MEKSNYFRRDGVDIHTDANISISQALLGGSIRIKGIHDDHTVQVIFMIYSSLIMYIKYLLSPSPNYFWLAIIVSNIYAHQSSLYISLLSMSIYIFYVQPFDYTPIVSLHPISIYFPSFFIIGATNILSLACRTVFRSNTN